MEILRKLDVGGTIFVCEREQFLFVLFIVDAGWGAQLRLIFIRSVKGNGRGGC